MASLIIKEKKEFMILKLGKVISLVPIETTTKPMFLIETASPQDMRRSGRCYTLEELAHGGKKKDQGKRLISDGEAEEFWKKMQLRTI